MGCVGRGDRHVTDRVGVEGVELLEGAVFEPQDAVGDVVEAVVVSDDNYGALVVGGECVKETCDLAAVGGVEVGGRLVSEDDRWVID